MAALKDIIRKISAVKQTQKITRAMNMVAASKLRGAQTRTENFRPYAAKFADVMGSLSSRIEPDIHPLLVQPDVVDKIGLLAFSADRGLCGSFNSNIMSGVQKFLDEKSKQDADVAMTLVGRKLKDYYRKRTVNITQSYGDLMSSFDYQVAAKLARDMMDMFMEGEVQEVWMCYTQFISMSKQVVTFSKLLPITPPAEADDDQTGGSLEYICEPSIEGIMIDLLPKSVVIQVYSAMLETSTSEQAARMAAMDNATKNCKELITDLTLVYNKARQAAVTAELLDIVCGAEALKKAS